MSYYPVNNQGIVVCGTFRDFSSSTNTAGSLKDKGFEDQR